MLPCAPYIKTMCQTFRPLLPASQDTTPQGSPAKRESEVRVTDIKGISHNVDIIESFNDNVSVYVLEDTPVRPTDMVADVAKALASFKPDSPDVTRAAKRFEKARRGEGLGALEETASEEGEAEGVTPEERRAEEEKRGARSKTAER
jgi:hypothetical protein